MKTISPQLIASVLLLYLLLIVAGDPAGADSPWGGTKPNSTTNENGLSERLINKAEWVFENATEVHYEHSKVNALEQVKELSNGALSCKNDCSGFMSYLIAATAPKQFKAIKDLQAERAIPQAKTFARFFGSLDSTQARSGWLRVLSVKDLRPGDFIAWEKIESQNPNAAKSNTGHVALVTDKAGPVFVETVADKTYRLISIPVMDSSSVYHFPPETLPPKSGQSHRDGLGKGSVRLALDQNDQAIAYWEGSYWAEGQKEIKRPRESSVINFARMIPTAP